MAFVLVPVLLTQIIVYITCGRGSWGNDDKPVQLSCPQFCYITKQTRISFVKRMLLMEKKQPFPNNLQEAKET